MKRLIGAKRIILAVLSFVLAAVLAGCGGNSGKSNPEGLLLGLSFDEGSGTQVSDSAGTVAAAELAYNFTNAAYMENRDPE